MYVLYTSILLHFGTILYFVYLLVVLLFQQDAVHKLEHHTTSIDCFDGMCRSCQNVISLSIMLDISLTSKSMHLVLTMNWRKNQLLYSQKLVYFLQSYNNQHYMPDVDQSSEGGNFLIAVLYFLFYCAFLWHI